MMNFISKWIVIFSLGFYSCKKENPPDIDKTIEIPEDTSATSASSVFIINEGNFQWGNSSISLYLPSTGQVQDKIFEKANNRPLGDVAQSMTIYNGKAYIVVNNSSKIEIVDPLTFKSLGIIENVSSPRFFLGVNSSKAYVSDIWGNKVSVIDLNSNSVVKSIAINGWTEEMLLHNSKAYVTNVYSEYIYIVNTTSDLVEDSIKVGYGSNSIQKDKNGKLWVLCEGDAQKNFKAGLYRINPENKQVELSLSYQNSGGRKLRISGLGESLFFLKDGVRKIKIEDTSLPNNPLIPETGQYWSLGMDKKSDILYIADAIDYVQAGTIHRYKSDGTKIDSFKTSIIPGEFCFK